MRGAVDVGKGAAMSCGCCVRPGPLFVYSWFRIVGKRNMSFRGLVFDAKA